MILKYFSLVLILGVLALVVTASFNFVNLRLLYQSALTGKDNLEYAVELLQAKQAEQAANFAESAENNFQFSASRLLDYQNNIIVTRLPLVNGQINEALYLLSTAEILSRSVKEISQFASGFSNLLAGEERTYSSLSASEKRQVLKKIYEAAPELSGIKANIDLAILNLNNVQAGGLLRPFKSQIVVLGDKLVKLDDLFDQLIPLSQVLPSIFGYPEKNLFLLVLQNSDELRPTGGFIGTYGFLSMQDGEIIRSDTHDIYHIDMPVQDKINVMPPEPIAKYLKVDKWYMRDANWSPSWPIAAEKIEWFFHQEDKLLPLKDQINKISGNFNGVIGLTPGLITDLLAYMGPLNVKGEEYNKDNFTRLLEYKVEKGYELLGVSSWHRKEDIGDIVKVLQEKIIALPLKQILEIGKILDRNLKEKNLLIYFKDKSLADIAQTEKWNGELTETVGDYFMVVDANLGSLKTDAVISRSIKYQLNQGVNGTYANLYIHYAHNGKTDWRTKQYQTYARVYVPLGSQLLSAEGLFSGQAETHNELGKTVFSGYVIIEPGKIGTLHFYYQLPNSIDNLIKTKNYQLYAQKQPGTRVEALTVDVRFMDNILSYYPTGFYIDKFKDSLKWETDLKTDKILNITLE